MKKPFYKRKRLWIPLVIFILIATPFILDPLKSFRTTVTYGLRLLGIQERTIRTGRYRVHFYEGGKEHPQTIVLLHGFGGNALLTWMQLMPSLAKKYHVVVPDLLASNFIRLNAKTYSIDSEIKVVLALLDNLQISKADFVGISVGGWISLLIALEHPEKVHRLVLVESAGILTEVPELAKLSLTDRDQARNFMKLLFNDPPPLPDFVLDAMVKTSTKIKDKYESVFAGFLKNSQDRLLDGKLSQIPNQTLVLHGRQDQVIPLEVGQKINAGLPNSELIILEDSGHAAVWDSSRLIKKYILTFLGNSN